MERINGKYIPEIEDFLLTFRTMESTWSAIILQLDADVIFFCSLLSDLNQLLAFLNKFCK